MAEHFCFHHHHAANEKGRDAFSSGPESSIRQAFWLNLSFALVELLGALYSNSLSLMSDALHDFGDALSLGLGLWLQKLSINRATPVHTYGFRRFSLLSALISGLVISVSSVFIFFNGIGRLLDPETIRSEIMMVFAGLGLVVNGYSFIKLSRGSSLNERVLKYHMLEDLVGWLVVLLGGGVIYHTQFYWIDPMLACLLALWIFWRMVGYLKKIFAIFMQTWPDTLPLEDMTRDILAVPGVKGVHHIHGWSLDGERNILTMHVVVEKNCSLEFCAKLKQRLKDRLWAHWKVSELTMELEHEEEICRDPHHVG
ncbi:MAG: cation diffusion facilitator family transporter [Bdellovibrionaceae bacterium]|nr:cation diffusion facilitator family transporter [Pseudobdellovibrionaceae bacterium]MDW8189856.1 cation diffusion facilitator family transporter [Pseudobdellovibrionaceae bacterium]